MLEENSEMHRLSTAYVRASVTIQWGLYLCSQDYLSTQGLGVIYRSDGEDFENRESRQSIS